MFQHILRNKFLLGLVCDNHTVHHKQKQNNTFRNLKQLLTNNTWPSYRQKVTREHSNLSSKLAGCCRATM